MSDDIDQSTFLENKAWQLALQKERMEKLEKRRLESLRKEVKRRDHYVKTGEWVYED
jgi:hypothetical protein